MFAFLPPSFSGTLSSRRTNCLSTSSSKSAAPRRYTAPCMVEGAGTGAAPAASNESIGEALNRLQQGSEPFHKHIAVLGSTGSIGTQTLDLVDAAPDKLSVSALTANSDVVQLVKQCVKYGPKYAAINDASKYTELKTALSDAGCSTVPLSGPEGIMTAASESDAETVVTGIVGCAGLLPTVAAIEAGKDIALANKETLIAAGPVIVPLVKKHGVAMTAADSEHSAIFQCLQGTPSKALRRIVLTASGGAFRDWKKDDLHKVTLEDALKHPNWAMGAKITIDSAAEVIEAHYLFGVPYDNIEAVIHRQSIIHSMVEFEDSSMLAQLGYPDMRLPLLYSITWPYRVDVELEKFDVLKYPSLTFEPIDFEKYPNMQLAYAAGRLGGTMTCVLNAANEAAVEMFRENNIHFLDIPKLNAAMMEQHREKNFIQNPTLEDIVNLDAETRVIAREFVNAGKLSPIRV